MSGKNRPNPASSYDKLLYHSDTQVMKKEPFDEFIESIKQAGKIQEGELNASQRIVITDSDVAETRKNYNLNQQEFSSRF
ncbi:hypothetical protein QA596_06420 [Balneolales bacterium ANBcel1]|nr:hypothetical protein [Balneolales bacterium ANBcel1]